MTREMSCRRCCDCRQACEVILITFTVLHCGLMHNSACLHPKMELFVSGVEALPISILCSVLSLSVSKYRWPLKQPVYCDSLLLTANCTSVFSEHLLLTMHCHTYALSFCDHASSHTGSSAWNTFCEDIHVILLDSALQPLEKRLKLIIKPQPPQCGVLQNDGRGLFVCTSVRLAYHRCEVRLLARLLPWKNLVQISHTRVQCSPI